MVKDKLDQAYLTNETMVNVFEFRAISQNAHRVILETIDKIDELASGANFQNVDEEIKTEGQVIRQILIAAKEALDLHQDFLSWVQPTESE